MRVLMAVALVGWGLGCGSDAVVGGDATAEPEVADPDGLIDTAETGRPDADADAAADAADDVTAIEDAREDSSDEVRDVADVEVSPYGLDERPSGTTCHAFARPELAAGGDVAYAAAFPNMDFGGQAISLVRTRIGPDGAMRWFVLDRLGEIWTFIDVNASKDGQATDGGAVERAERYLDLPETPYGSSGEGGLLGFAFDPEFGLKADANYVYVHYTTYPRNNVWRFRVGATGDADEPWEILESKEIFVTRSGGGNHWGGALEFGPDGYLYISLGDGGNGMTASDAVKLTWLRGKILRIDPKSSGAAPYLIPPDNPFATPGAALCGGRELADNTDNCPEIFARGFRNPWRMSFDRETGYLWVGDVGTGKEEVNLVLPGHDYGWNRCDGRNPKNNCPPAKEDSALIAPIAQYRVYNSASIAGGVIYRGTALGSALQGAYLFTDVYNGDLFVIDRPYSNVGFSPFRVNQVFEHPDEDDEDDLPRFRKLDVARLPYPVAWAQDELGEVYVVTFGAGKGKGIYKLVPPGEVVLDSVPATLTATGCVAGDPTEPAAGMIGYDINAPFWSDGADKERYVSLPDGQTIAVGVDGDWDLPIGSVVTKLFRIDGRPIETRLMVRHADGAWAGYSYVWRADGSDADKANLLGEERVWGEQTWRYPSRAACMTCHTEAAGFTLGLETRQLDRDYRYGVGREANQISTLAHIGVFSGDVASDLAAAFPVPFGDAPVAQRARSYLHTNCAQCHRGAVVPDLHIDTGLAETGLCAEKRLVPGAPAASTMVMRMRSDDLLFRMPRGGGLRIDEDGARLIEAWIEGLESCP